MTNYKKYFGTPELAAETLERVTDTCGVYPYPEACPCEECVLRGCPCGEPEKVLEWLKEESDV